MLELQLRRLSDERLRTVRIADARYLYEQPVVSQHLYDRLAKAGGVQTAFDDALEGLHLIAGGLRRHVAGWIVDQVRLVHQVAPALQVEPQREPEQGVLASPSEISNLDRLESDREARQDDQDQYQDHCPGVSTQLALRPMFSICVVRCTASFPTSCLRAASLRSW